MTSAHGWSQPLRLHLSVVIVVLLLGISLPLMWLTYRQGTSAATHAAEQQIQLLRRHVIDRYRGIFADGSTAIALTSASEAFVSEPPAALGLFELARLAATPLLPRSMQQRNSVDRCRLLEKRLLQ